MTGDPNPWLEELHERLSKHFANIANGLPTDAVVFRVDGFDEPGIQLEINEVFLSDNTIYVDFVKLEAAEEE